MRTGSGVAETHNQRSGHRLTTWDVGLTFLPPLETMPLARESGTNRGRIVTVSMTRNQHDALRRDAMTQHSNSFTTSTGHIMSGADWLDVHFEAARHEYEARLRA